MEDESNRTVLNRTYNFLRLGMVGAVAILGISVVIEMVDSSGCWQRSISAYYYTPSRGVFVGALLALGLGMIVLTSLNNIEDAFLNLAGLLAPVVAFVPTSDANYCSVATTQSTSTLDDLESTRKAQEAADKAIASAHAAIDNNVIALLAVVALALVAVPIVLNKNKNKTSPQVRALRWENPYRLSYLLAMGFWVAGLVSFVWFTDAFYARAHFTAAVSLFICVIIVVFSNAYDRKMKNLERDEVTREWLRRLFGRLMSSLSDRYGILGGAMVVSALLMVTIGPAVDWDHWVLAVEADLIVLFGVFWVMSTFELWDKGSRRPAAPQAPAAPQEPATAPA